MCRSQNQSCGQGTGFKYPDEDCVVTEGGNW